MTTVICDLNVRNQQIKQLTLFGFPDDFLVKQLPSVRPQQLDHPPTMREVVPEPFGVKKLELLFVIPGQFAQAPIVEKEPSVFIDDTNRGRTVIENLAKLTLLFGDCASCCVSAVMS